MNYRAGIDVPRHVVEYLARLLAAHRRCIRTPRGSRALSPFRQAVLVRRWFRERGCVHCLARDAGVSQATGYRYLHEGIDILVDQAPDLHEVPDRCRREGMTHVILDGTLIESDRVAGLPAPALTARQRSRSSPRSRARSAAAAGPTAPPPDATSKIGSGTTTSAGSTRPLASRPRWRHEPLGKIEWPHSRRG